MKNFLFLFFFLLSQIIFGQYTEVINSNYPGFSKSPYSLGTGVYQVENSIFYHHDSRNIFFTKKRSIGTNLAIRAGLFSEKLEFNANFKLQQDHILNNLVLGRTMSISGISEFNVGAKYIIFTPKYQDKSKEIRSWKKRMSYDWSRLIPAVGIYAGLNTNWLSTRYKAPSISPKAGILLQQDFDDWTTLVTNVYGNYLTLEKQRSYGLVTTLTYSMTDRFSIFGELRGDQYRYSRIYKAGGGFAYLATKDLQIGIQALSEIQFEHIVVGGGLSISWRLDRHHDKEIRTKSDGSGEKVAYKRDGFFKRLFGKGRRGKAPKQVRGKKRRQTRAKKPKKKRERRKRRRR